MSRKYKSDWLKCPFNFSTGSGSVLKEPFSSIFSPFPLLNIYIYIFVVDVKFVIIQAATFVLSVKKRNLKRRPVLNLYEWTC